MSLEYAILGILNVVPMTGYDLKHKAFDATVQHFWPADQSQIYRTLSRLEERGWASMHIEPQEDRPDRKVYSITAEGVQALHSWLSTEQALPTYRDPFLVQLFFGMETDNETLLALVDAQLLAHRERLAAYHQIPIPPAHSRPNDRWLGLQHLTLDFGLAFEETYVRWLEQCRQIIETLPGPEESDDFRAAIMAPPAMPDKNE